MKQNAASRQPDLFDMDEHQTVPIPAQREQLATLVEALLREIASAPLGAAQRREDGVSQLGPTGAFGKRNFAATDSPPRFDENSGQTFQLAVADRILSH